MTETLNSDPRFDGKEKEPEFKTDIFTAELLDSKENAYTVDVHCESFIFNGQVRIVALEISGNVSAYTLEDTLEIISSRNGNRSTWLDATPNLITK